MQQQRSTKRPTRSRRRRQDRRAVHGVEARLRPEGRPAPPRQRRPRRLTGRDGRSQFCASLLRLVLVSYTDAAGAGGGLGPAGDAAPDGSLDRAVRQIARKGMRLMLLERTARQGWDRRRGR